MSFKNVQTLVSELERRYLECAICTDIFDEDAHVPLIIPCHHTLCKACVKKISRKDYLKCPTCNTVHQINRKTIDYPKDNIRRDLNSFLQTKNTTQLLKCHVCESYCENYLRCRQCNIFLCDTCKHFHLVENNTHMLVQKSNKTFHETILDVCSNPAHHNTPLIYYCESLNCQKTLCPICAMENHRDPMEHDIYYLDDASKRIKSRLKDSIHELREKIEQFKQQVQFADDSIVSLEARIERLKAYKENENNISNVLDKRIKDHRQRLHKITELKRKVQNFIENAQDCITLADQVHLEHQPLRFLKIYHMLDKHIKGFRDTSFKFEDFDVTLPLEDDRRLLQTKIDENPSKIERRSLSMEEKPKNIIKRLKNEVAYRYMYGSLIGVISRRFDHNTTGIIFGNAQNIRRAQQRQINILRAKGITLNHKMPTRRENHLLKKDQTFKIIYKPDWRDIIYMSCVTIFAFLYEVELYMKETLLFIVALLILCHIIFLLQLY